MTIQKYIEESARTSEEDTLVHSALGICGEVAELHENENFVEELGDLMWYVAMAYRELNASPEFDLEHIASSTCGHATKYAEAVKKLVYNKRDTGCKKALDLIYSSCVYECRHRGYSLNGILAANIKKLKKRYPNGYSREAAAERIDKQ